MIVIPFRNSVICKVLLAASIAAGVGTSARADSTPSSNDPAAPQAHSDGLGAAVTDTVITAKVKSRFSGDDRLGKSTISVVTTNGVVTLTGSASSSDAKSAAEAVASGVDGVKSVDDQLQAPSSADTMAASVDKAAAATEKVASDSWITTKVKSEIMADSVSKGFEVSVDTRHGVVELKGTLASQDAIDHVKDITFKVKGVKSVNTSSLKIASN